MNSNNKLLCITSDDFHLERSMFKFEIIDDISDIKNFKIYKNINIHNKAVYYIENILNSLLDQFKEDKNISEWYYLSFFRIVYIFDLIKKYNDVIIDIINKVPKIENNSNKIENNSTKTRNNNKMIKLYGINVNKSFSNYIEKLIESYLYDFKVEDEYLKFPFIHIKEIFNLTKKLNDDIIGVINLPFTEEETGNDYVEKVRNYID